MSKGGLGGGGGAKRTAMYGLGGLVVLFGLIQLVPYGHAHANPPVVQEPKWDSQQTHDLAVRACYDCHSNQVNWRWYTSVAPFSWLTQHDVEDGRRRLNFSELNRPQRDAGQAAREVQRGDMPPWYSLPVHPEAKLSPAEQQALIAGLRATLGETAPERGPGRPGDV